VCAGDRLQVSLTSFFRKLKKEGMHNKIKNKYFMCALIRGGLVQKWRHKHRLNIRWEVCGVHMVCMVFRDLSVQIELFLEANACHVISYTKQCCVR
jgi:hypothetical protein